MRYYNRLIMIYYRLNIINIEDNDEFDFKAAISFCIYNYLWFCYFRYTFVILHYIVTDVLSEEIIGEHQSVNYDKA